MTKSIAGRHPHPLRTALGATAAGIRVRTDASSVAAVSFLVTAAAYDAYMGRFAAPLAALVVDQMAPRPGQQALDVGCGPGAVTSQLIERLGVHAVHAIDPSATFVAAVRERWPDLDVRQGVAEQLPVDDDSIDLCVAQLVVHFMSDPVAGLAEMARVTRPGGVVTASVWDFGGQAGPVDVFWRAARELDPDEPGERQLPGAREGHLVELAQAARLREVHQQRLVVSSRYATFREWWDSFTLGVGPAGAYLAAQDDTRREQLRRRCAQLLPAGPFTITAAAWSVTARR